MKERADPAEGQALTLGDEFMRAMLETVQKNTDAISEANDRIGKVAETLGQLLPVMPRIEALEREWVSVKETLAALQPGLARPVVSPGDVGKLRDELAAHTAFFREPWKKEIHHRHFLGWPVVVVCLALGFAFSVLTLLLIQVDRADRYREHDIEWRYARLIRDPKLLRRLDSAEAKYALDPHAFRKFVAAEELRLKELAQKELEKEADQQAIDSLRKAERRY
ncbi:MAG TPA: hypothetical protein VHE54_06945 [Puia sp.]|nr:hypothetical protein [Puia sp.]